MLGRSVRRRPCIRRKRVAAVLAADAGVDFLGGLAGLALLTFQLQGVLLGGGDGGGLGGFGLGAGLGDGLTLGDASLANRFEFGRATLFAVDESWVGDGRLGLEFFEQSLLGRGCRFQAVGEFGIF